MPLDAGEELVGKAGDKDDSINIISSQYSTMLCSNCQKKIHCIAGSKGDSPPEMLKDRCSKKDCECRCRRYYVGKDGRLRRYGTPDNSILTDSLSERKERTPLDDLIDEWNSKKKSS